MRESCAVEFGGIAETAKVALKRRSPYWVRSVVAAIGDFVGFPVVGRAAGGGCRAGYEGCLCAGAGGLSEDDERVEQQ